MIKLLIEEVIKDYDERALLGAVPSLGSLDAARQTIFDNVAGFGALQPLLDDPTVEEIWINAPSRAVKLLPKHFSIRMTMIASHCSNSFGVSMAWASAEILLDQRGERTSGPFNRSYLRTIPCYFCDESQMTILAFSGVAIVAGLLCAMSDFLFQLRGTLGMGKRPREEDYVLVVKCIANTLGAILWGLALAFFLVVGDSGKWIGDDQAGPVLTGIAVAATVYFLLVHGGLCLKLLRRAYERIVMRPS